MTRRALRITFGILLSLAVIGVFEWFYTTPYATRIEYALLDYWFRLRGPVADRGDVVKVIMDEASYQNLGVAFDQAWPRSLHVKLLEKFRQAGVRKVVFDVLFLEAGSNGEVDAALAKAFAGVSTVLASDQGARMTGHGLVTEMLMPYEPFAKVSTVALAGLPETGGYVRQFRLPDSESELPALAEAAANLAVHDERPSEFDLINFYGPAGFIPSYSVYQVLEEAVPFPLEKLRGKVIFVGLELRSGIGPEQKDSFLTSFDENGRHFGVEIHATAAANLIAKDWIRRASPVLERLILAVLLACICAACLFLRPLRSAVVIVLMLGVWLGASLVLFQMEFFLPALSVAAVFAPAVYVVSTLMYYLLSKQSQRALRRAFELYVSPHTAAQVARDPKALGLGGKKVVATAFFTDIADFTKICESMPAEKVTEMLNDYFSEIVDFIFASQGTLIKFIGDAVFALWGAPVAQEHHADAALRAGLEIQQRLKTSVVLKKYPRLHTRIGINTGEMVVGNLGSRKRFDFTAIGDPVNLASRVEGLNKYLGTSVLMTESTRQHLKGSYRLCRMGKVRVVGKTELVHVYTVFENLTDELHARWEGALQSFEQRQWIEAREKLRSCGKDAPELAEAAAFYEDQLRSHEVLAPATQWAGELILESK